MHKILELAPLFGALGALIGALSLLVAIYQVTKAIQWNRVQAAFTYFPNPLTLEALENELDETLRFWTRSQPISRDECQLLFFQTDLRQPEIDASMKATRDTLSRLGRTPPTEDRDLLLEMRKSGRKLKAYVNEVERYAAAVNAGVVDDVTARCIYSAKFLGHYDRLKELISMVQQARGASVYCELGRLANRWRSVPPGMPTRYPGRWRTKRAVP